MGNKQIEGRSPWRCGTSLPLPDTRIALARCLIFPGRRENRPDCSTFPRRKCPVPPKYFPQMERTTTTSCRTADPTSFLTGKTRCEGSAPSGKSSVTPRSSRSASRNRCIKKKKGGKITAVNMELRVGLVCPSLPSSADPPSLHVAQRSPRRSPSPAGAAVMLALPLSLSYVSSTAAFVRSLQLIGLDAPPARCLARPFLERIAAGFTYIHVSILFFWPSLL